MNSSRVVIVVPTLGKRSDWLSDALASVRDQGEDVGIIVVTPDVESVSNVAHRWGATVILEPRRGLSKAINTGFERAIREGELVGWLGDDDLLAPGSIVSVCDALAAKPAAPFAVGRTRYIDASGQTRYVARCGRLGLAYSKVGWNLIPQPGALFRSTDIDRVGPLDEDLSNAMDLDLFLRLMKGSKPIALAVEVSAYRWHESSISSTKPDRSEAERVRIAQGGRGTRLVIRATRGLRRHALDRIFHRLARRYRASSPALTGRGRPYTERGAYGD